jgi:hypothetical protein
MSAQDNDYVTDVDEEMVVDITDWRVPGLIARNVNERPFSFNTSKELRTAALPTDQVKK